jgi:hypothetical protein
MRTRAWAMKGVNTQLASWTQLRHDTVLYVKQSVTMSVMCYYPAGYVEPVPYFWDRMEKMTTRAADLLQRTPYPAARKEFQQRHVQFLRSFARTTAVLRGIAEKELSQKPLDKDEVKFLENVVQVHHGCGGPPTYSGWYPGLFYADRKDSAKCDAIVADVHTDPPDPVVADPGCVLHEAVGGVDLLMVAIDNGKDRMVYAGPVLSHYEFEMPASKRKADSEWRTDLTAGRVPPRPEWTRSYLVPGVNQSLRKLRAD